MDEKQKKLRKMAIWTIAVFATVFAIAFAVLWLPIYQMSPNALSAIGQIFSTGWMLFVLAAVLCIGAYLGYKLYLDKKK